MGPGDLTEALCGLSYFSSPNVLRGVDSMDNAGVYKITDDLALVQTVDFFTPIVDDPYAFGQIAVANSLSDVYTMGGIPVTAMNIVCFPTKSMDISVLKDVLRGGADKLCEAEVVLIGGHSVDDLELKYGLAVTGTVHPARMLTNGGAKPGDRLILTKPLGTGIISTAVKARAAGQETIAKVTQCMATLNRVAAQAMVAAGANACTDITGFGFLGHTIQMAQNSGVGMNISLAAIPYFPEAAGFARQGFCPGGLHRNRQFYESSVKLAKEIPAHMRDILHDPQTSGGLLISIDAAEAETLLNQLKAGGVPDAAVVGEVVSESVGTVTVS